MILLRNEIFSSSAFCPCGFSGIRTIKASDKNEAMVRYEK